MTALPRPLCGIVPPMLTPLADRDTLDHAALDRLVEHILAGGVHGLFVLGTTGEGPSLSYRLRCELVERVCQQVAGRVPVLVGATDTSFVESVNLAEFSADAGAAAVVLAAPCYFPAGQDELARYFEEIATALPLPLVLYNMPSHTKLHFGLEMLRRLTEHRNIVGMKDSSADMIYFHRLQALRELRPDWTLMVGPEELLGESVLLGGNGGVCGGANLCPRLYVELYDAAVRGDVPRVRQLHGRVMQLAQSLYTVAQGGAAVGKGLKAALACQGVIGDALAEPFNAMTDDQRALLQQRLADLHLEEFDTAPTRSPK